MEDDKKSSDGSKKKLVIRRVTVSALKVQAGLRTGAGSCDNKCLSPVPVPQLPSATTGCPATGRKQM